MLVLHVLRSETNPLKTVLERLSKILEDVRRIKSLLGKKLSYCFLWISLGFITFPPPPRPPILEWGTTGRQGSCSMGNTHFELAKRCLFVMLGKSMINSVKFWERLLYPYCTDWGLCLMFSKTLYCFVESSKCIFHLRAINHSVSDS